MVRNLDHSYLVGESVSYTVRESVTFVILVPDLTLVLTPYLAGIIQLIFCSTQHLNLLRSSKQGTSPASYVPDPLRSSIHLDLF
ncbi:hypothetical protein IGI04_023336 [Brassica rapa subsp. trilocularis]|uniref:Uncharacterized protein n=1 Tax=Brassica rapa subsp. trilocularis TaxID=1813537 RepID=A0ABQ7M5Q6_BRACM|nr:hypothetical protein IGI04_023336 [Brassica rapa subsp. trilocularis]